MSAIFGQIGRGVLPIAVVAGALALGPPAAAEVKLAGGTTTLTLSSAAAKALSRGGVKVKPIRPATTKAGIAFPITGGSIDPATAAGTIESSGGLRFKLRGRRVTFKNFVARIGQSSSLTAKARKSRARIFKLNTRGAKVSRSQLATNVSGIAASLTAKGARLLNSGLGVKVFKRGQRVGSVSVAAEPAELELDGVATTLSLASGAVATLNSFGVQAAPVSPATSGSSGLSFPITGGKVDAKTLAGQIQQSGGISLTMGSIFVEFKDFQINIDDSPDLTAMVGSSRIPILSLDASKATQQVSDRTVTLGQIGVTLTTEAAQLLNQTFGTNVVTAGLALGTMSVEARSR